MNSVACRVYLVAGEASGDARGAELMRALRGRCPEMEFFGVGGREMKALGGAHLLDWAEEAVVGLWDVLKKYGYFKRQFDRVVAEIVEVRPDAVILIDYPGFNLRLAKALSERGRGKRPTSNVQRPTSKSEALASHAKPKIIYYISPQVWAWNRGRIPKMARFLDLMLCIFPFEKSLYEQSGLKTVFVGHPMLDSLAAKRISAARDPHLVGLFPGSRDKEVRRIFPVMIDAAFRMKQARRELRFEAAAASHPLADKMLGMLQLAGNDGEFCAIHVRSSHELMQRAAAGMVCSGTATLEAAFFGLPLVVIYKVAWLTWVIGKRLVKVPFLGMPNVLAEREIAREFLQHDAEPAAIAREMLRLLSDHAAREQQQRELAAIVAQLGERGATERAATAVCELLGIARPDAESGS